MPPTPGISPFPGKACADRSGSGRGAYSHLNGPEFLPDALHGCGVFLFDGAPADPHRPLPPPTADTGPLRLASAQARPS